MPPSSLPTGTVSHESTSARTYPSEPASRPGPSDQPTAGVTSPPTPRAPTTEADTADAGAEPASRSSLRERVTELERENDALRAALDSREAHLQSVIDRYEDLLAKRTGTRRRSSSSGTTSGLVGRVLQRLGLR